MSASTSSSERSRSPSWRSPGSTSPVNARMSRLLPARWTSAGSEVAATIGGEGAASPFGRFLADGQLAELAAIPFAHVGQVPFHLAAPGRHLALLFFQHLGLLRKPGRVGIHLPGLFVHLGAAPLQPGLALAQRPLHFDDLRLPVDDVLAESGDGQAMFVPSPGAVPGPADGLAPPRSARRPAMLPGLPGLAGRSRAVRRGARASGREIGRAARRPPRHAVPAPAIADGGPVASCRVMAMALRDSSTTCSTVRCSTSWRPRSSARTLRSAAMVRPISWSFCRDISSFWFQPSSAACWASSSLLRAVSRSSICCRSRCNSSPLRLHGGHLGLEAGDCLFLAMGLLGQQPLPGRQFFRSPMQLFLQRRTHLLRPCQVDLAFLERLAVAFHPRLQFGELGGTHLEDGFLLGQLRRLGVGYPECVAAMSVSCLVSDS